MNELENKPEESEVKNDAEKQEIHWQPVAKNDPYQHANAAVRRYHKEYVEMWLKNKKSRS
ncbi:MAG: hypothetical protein IJ864_04390 [Alphaproteobacteria bacterium]|nr:hypothetical protein [Alphaproteobacteria bacterium]